MSMGKRIKEALGNRELKELHGSIEGLTQQNLSAMIKRDAKTSEFALRIADKLGVSIRWLLDGVGDRDARDWPFPGIERSRFDALTRDQQIEVQHAVRETIQAFEAEAAAPRRKRTRA